MKIFIAHHWITLEPCGYCVRLEGDISLVLDGKLRGPRRRKGFNMWGFQNFGALLGVLITRIVVYIYICMGPFFGPPYIYLEPPQAK